MVSNAISARWLESTGRDLRLKRQAKRLRLAVQKLAAAWVATILSSCMLFLAATQRSAVAFERGKRVFARSKLHSFRRIVWSWLVVTQAKSDMKGFRRHVDPTTLL